MRTRLKASKFESQKNSQAHETVYKKRHVLPGRQSLDNLEANARRSDRHPRTS